MGKNHLKSMAAPKAWSIKRKGTKFVTKPLAGAHSLDSGMPLSVLLKDILKYANTTSDVKKILNINEVKIDGIVRKDARFSVGIFDTIAFDGINEYFRIVINKKGRLDCVKIKKEEATIKPCKIIGKIMVRGRLQLNLYDGNNIFSDKDSYKVGDSLLISLPEKKISKHLKIDKKATIFLIGGNHIGEIGNVEEITKNKVLYKDQKGNLVETSKNYAFVVGEDKPLITLE